MKNLVDALKEIISELQGKEGKKGAEKQPRISAISRPIPKEQEEQKTDQSISSEKESGASTFPAREMGSEAPVGLFSGKEGKGDVREDIGRGRQDPPCCFT